MKYSIINPFKQKVEVEILNRNEGETLINTGNSRIIDKMKMVIGNKNIYQLYNLANLIDYTKEDFMILVPNPTDTKKLLENEEFGNVIIHKWKGKYYYMFDLSPYYFLNLSDELIEIEDHRYIRTIHHPNREKEKYKLALDKNNGLVFYFHRSGEIYQGNWFPNFETLDYFYDNDYA